MTNDVYASIGTRRAVTPQTEQASPDQVRNNAGGFTFKLDDRQTLRRFLILGTDAGTYYASAKDHTTKAADVLLRMSKAGDMALIEEIREVSLEGLAPKQEPTLLALAVASASPNDPLRMAALDSVKDVCRTFTMLATYTKYVKTFRGVGRGLRRAIAAFYEDKTAEQVAYQFVKYPQREGYTHRDMLRLAHPAADTDEKSAVFTAITGNTGKTGGEVQPVPILQAVEMLKGTTSAESAAALITAHRLPWEVVPDALVNESAVLEALMPHMGATALLRQLPRFARAGMTGGSFGGALSTDIIAKLTDPDFISKGRLHPYQVLLARVTYGSGRSIRGSSTWTPDRKIVEALEHTFDLSFKTIVPSGKRTGLFLDVSGSMGAAVGNDGFLSCRDASAAMAMATARSEPYTLVAGFTGGGWYSDQKLENISLLDITASDSLSSTIRKVSGLPFGGTDCSLPMLWAKVNEPTIETFVVYTDNETYAGSIHPHQALRDYRNATGINAKLIVVGMATTDFSIADPSDPGMLDVVGFDASAPKIMAEFAAGRI